MLQILVGVILGFCVAFAFDHRAQIAKMIRKKNAG